jgi:hypothetical protein
LKILRLAIIVIASILAFTIITNQSHAQTQTQDALSVGVALANYGQTSYSGYFLPGEQINFVGNVLDNTKHVGVTGAKVDLILTCPNGTITKVASTTSGSDSSYGIVMPVTGGFSIGEYVVNVSASKDGYVNDINYNSAAFFLVARGGKQIIRAEGEDFPVYIESIELQTGNLTFNKDTKSLNFDVKPISGDYSPKGISWINGLPDPNQIFVTFKRPLLSAPFHVFVNNQEVYTKFSENQTFYFLDLALTDSETSGQEHVSIIGTYVIPEFPFAIPVFLIGVTSLIVFFRVKFR